MSLNAISKYIITFLFATIIIVSIMLMTFISENKALHKQVAVQKEQIVLRDTTITALENNINSLQLQVIEAEKICDLRIKAREDSLYILNKNNPQESVCIAGVEAAKLSAPASQQNKVYYDIVTKDKSEFAINNINKYWSRMFAHTSNNEK